MLLLAAGHIKLVYCVQLQLQSSSFLNAKIIQKHTNTYYSSIFLIHMIHLYHVFISSSVFQ